jgi:hypothetical protein
MAERSAAIRFPSHMQIARQIGLKDFVILTQNAFCWVQVNFVQSGTSHGTLFLALP